MDSNQSRTSWRTKRLLFGALGIFIGIVGFVNIVLERRAADERRRVLTTLAENTRRADQERRPPVSDTSAVVWEGQTFRPGDRVQIMKWAGTFKGPDTGAKVDVVAGRDHVGVVIGGEARKRDVDLGIDPSEPIQVVRVRWDAQRWKAIGRDQWLDLPAFEATIHVSYLQVIR